MVDLVGADLSVDGLLAVSRSYREGCPVRVETLVVDPISSEIQVAGHGLAPAWSPDGNWLAYTELDGIYIVRKDGSEPRRVVQVDSRRDPCDGYGWFDGLPAPSWSPDGKWLVYHRLAPDGPVIYKLNLDSGKEIEVYRGGSYPDWRWDE